MTERSGRDLKGSGRGLMEILCRYLLGESKEPAGRTSVRIIGYPA
jgi:hypothetical protein